MQALPVALRLLKYAILGAVLGIVVVVLVRNFLFYPLSQVVGYAGGAILGVVVGWLRSRQ